MPSETITPASFAITWGEVVTEPARVTAGALALALTMGSVVAGPGLSPGLTDDLQAVTDTLFASEAIVDDQGRPTRRFQQIWQNTIEALVTVVTSQGGSISELQAIYAGINTAQSTASTAVQLGQTTERRRGHEGSYTSPVAVLSAASDGTVTIIAHQRFYLDDEENPVSVDGGNVTGFAPGDNVTVYYADPARAGGAVSYQGTTSAVAQTGDTLVAGQVPIPEVGQPSQSGTSPTAPGWGYPEGYDPNGAYLV